MVNTSFFDLKSGIRKKVSTSFRICRPVTFGFGVQFRSDLLSSYSRIIQICEHRFEYSIIIGSGSTGELCRYYPNGDLFPGDPLPIELIDDQVDLTAQNMNMSISSIET